MLDYVFTTLNFFLLIHFLVPLVYYNIANEQNNEKKG